MDETLDRHAGKRPEDQHPVEEGGPAEGDLRVAQFGEDPPGEDAMEPVDED